MAGRAPVLCMLLSACAAVPSIPEEDSRSPGYTIQVYAEDLRAPDGLAFDSNGAVCVVEEKVGRLTRIAADGTKTALLDGLRSPEGIALGPDGSLYVVEDAANGRLLRVRPGGEVDVLAQGLDAPEGVLVVGETIYYTESTLQLVGNLFDGRSRVSALSLSDGADQEPEIITDCGAPLSFSELVAAGPDGLIVVNETSGGIIRASLMSLAPFSGAIDVHCSGLISPEGICATPGAEGPFPLFVAEEDIDGEGHGQLVRIDEEGEVSIVATGFGTLEDVLVASNGCIYLSEDSTGRVLLLTPIDLAAQEI